MKKVIATAIVTINLAAALFGASAKAPEQESKRINWMYFNGEDGQFSINLENQMVYKWDGEEYIVWSGNAVEFFEEAPYGNVSFN